MRGEERRQRSMLMVVDLEQRVPKGHPLRRGLAIGGKGAQGAVSDIGPDVQRGRKTFDSARAAAQGVAADGVVHSPQRTAVLRGA